jgi:hypothetical protein
MWSALPTGVPSPFHLSVIGSWGIVIDIKGPFNDPIVQSPTFLAWDFAKIDRVILLDD